MSGPSRAKALLRAYNRERYESFILNNEEVMLDLPQNSPIPWVVASNRKDHYVKTTYQGKTDPNHNVKFIEKNGEHHSQIWETSPEFLKEGVRWGIVKTTSIVSKVTAALGQYRLDAHERIAKGMESNSQPLKLKLLDLYQDRIQELNKIELLVNKNNTYETYKVCFEDYIQKLERLRLTVSSYFEGLNFNGFDKKAIEQIKDNITNDITNDIARAQEYLNSMIHSSTLKANNRARGEDSVLEFVKQQLLHHLYELQGINQDMTYSLSRRFALTRGKLNDAIEDARIVIDDHMADPRNAVTAKHQGSFDTKTDESVSYDFSNDDLSPADERKALLAISFIEGWDSVEYENGKPFVRNGKDKESLDTIYATRWQTHRNGWVFLKSIFYFVVNIFKSLFTSTYPWEEEVWSNKEFHLVAATLRKAAKPNKPMWHKPVAILKSLFYAIRDIGSGIREVGREIVVEMPIDITIDWISTSDLPPLDEVLTGALAEIEAIKKHEEETLSDILNQCGAPPPPTGVFKSISQRSLYPHLGGSQ